MGVTTGATVGGAPVGVTCVTVGVATSATVGGAPVGGALTLTCSFS